VVLLYFYPKDDTPGCTKEACGFRDRMAELKKNKVDVIGVSFDSSASHQKFTAWEQQCTRKEAYPSERPVARPSTPA
jgi:peroxiredoxin